MMELWLVRHGQSDWNSRGRWQGQASHAPGLTDIGRAQALAVREQLKGAHYSAIYSSDLLRSRQTAELLAEPLGLTVTVEPRLREMNFGAWEGMLLDEIKAQYPGELAERERNPSRARAPNGESPREVEERVIPAVNEIANKHRGGSILIVSHSIPLAVIICHAQGISLDEIYKHIPENAKPYRVEWKRN